MPATHCTTVDFPAPFSAQRQHLAPALEVDIPQHVPCAQRLVQVCAPQDRRQSMPSLTVPRCGGRTGEGVPQAKELVLGRGPEQRPAKASPRLKARGWSYVLLLLAVQRPERARFHACSHRRSSPGSNRPLGALACWLEICACGSGRCGAGRATDPVRFPGRAIPCPSFHIAALPFAGREGSVDVALIYMSRSGVQGLLHPKGEQCALRTRLPTT